MLPPSRQAQLTDLLGFDGSQRLHQAALAACSIILVDNAFFRSLIKVTDRLEHSGLIGLAGIDGSAGCTYGDAGGATESAVAQTLLLVLTVALDLRFNISQGLSSEK
jgi:hypothetical protein